MDRYDWHEMGLEHPLDAEVRTRLRAAEINQTDMARALGRPQSWLNKYMHGAGHATVDDVVRMLALLIGLEVKPITGHCLSLAVDGSCAILGACQSGLSFRATRISLRSSLWTDR